MDCRTGRGWSRRALALFGSLAVAVGCGAETPDSPPLTALQSDPRIRELFTGCVRFGFYDRFVDEMIPILVEKLRTVGGAPLKRAKEELGEAGVQAVPALRRLVDESFTDPRRAPHLENAVDALGLNPSIEAHDALIRLLSHPMESVRRRAMLGLVGRTGQRSDFDAFLVRAQGNEPLQLRRLYLRGMFEADQVRAARVALAWIRDGEHPEYALDIASRVAECDDEAVAQLCGEIYPNVSPLHAVSIAAPAARRGDAAALAYLREELEHQNPARRLGALRALQAAGLVDELGVVLADDPDESVRIFAIEAIATATGITPNRTEWLAAALTDGSLAVRSQALLQLCRLGDSAARDAALSHLRDERGELQSALVALREVLKTDTDLALRAFDVLAERHELEALRSVQERAATYKAMGLVPLRRSAAFLRRIAFEEEGERIESLRAHEWLMIQASNTGPAGRELLWEELAGERDPLRRIDLIAALSSTREEESRAWIRARLLELIEGGADSPEELVFAAGRLVKIGPSSICAPRLKLVCNAIEDVEAQIALQCLLWAWY